MAGRIIKNYGTVMKGMPLKKNTGDQKLRTPKSQGKSPYPNGSSKKSK